MKSVGSRIANTLLVVGSILMTYAVIEFLVFPQIFPHLPEKYYHYGTRDTRRLIQPSVNGTVPSGEYIAMLGDSYAAGAGDWFNRQGWDLMTEYHSANIIHRRMGKDVFVFGVPGAGSVDGACVNPIHSVRYIRNVGFSLPSPETVLYYFYEGNDLTDNTTFINKYYRPENDNPCDDRQLDTFLGEFIAEKASGVPDKFGDRLLFANMLYRMVYYKPWKNVPQFDDTQDTRTNRVLINGRETPVATPLFSSAFALTDAQHREALCLLKGALRQSSAFFSDSRYVVVYLPSPPVCYEAESPLRVVWEGDEMTVDPAELNRRSDTLAAQVAAIAAELGLEFLDARPAMRQAALRDVIHGPTDWTHYNEIGYTALGDFVADFLKTK